MLFPTLTFAVFFALVYPVCWLLRWRPGAWKVFVLLASYVFYGFWDRRFVLLIIASSVVNAFLAWRIARADGGGAVPEAGGGPAPGSEGGRPPAATAEAAATGGTAAGEGAGGRRRRWLLAGAVSFDLALLGVFKYYGFFVESADALLHAAGLPARLPLVAVLVPVGISFFTFQAISYVVDVYRRRVPPARWLDVAVYLAFFPHLVAGPIVRASEFLPQLHSPRALPRRDATRAAFLIGQGLFKKVVISSYLATAIVDPVFGVPAGHSAPEILLAVYGYAMQIYADFSGYTDMAIGIALLLGIRFPQNFDRPYSAVSLQDFWRRWHMTLSRWLRDYLYIPLGGSRRGRWETYRNLLLTMALGGLWHGAALTFVVWGVFHGLGLALERLLHALLGGRGRPPAGDEGSRPGRAARRASLGLTWLGRLVTFNVVCLGWVLFRADSLATAGELLHRTLTAWGPAPAATAGLVAVVAGMLALQLLPLDLGRRLEEGFAGLPLPVQGAALGTFCAAVVALGPAGVAPFIYYQF